MLEIQRPYLVRTLGPQPLRGDGRLAQPPALAPALRHPEASSDPHGVIRGGDMVLIISISEAMPMTLLEAMAQGRPSVATSVGGVPGVLRGCGIVAPPGDVHAIATAIVTLLRNPALAAQLGRRGYERLHRRYTFERRIAAYRDLINELIEATHQRLHRQGAAPAPGQRSGAERLLPG